MVILGSHSGHLLSKPLKLQGTFALVCAPSRLSDCLFLFEIKDFPAEHIYIYIYICFLIIFCACLDFQALWLSVVGMSAFAKSNEYNNMNGTCRIENQWVASMQCF